MYHCIGLTKKGPVFLYFGFVATAFSFLQLWMRFISIFQTLSFSFFSLLKKVAAAAPQDPQIYMWPAEKTGQYEGLKIATVCKYFPKIGQLGNWYNVPSTRNNFPDQRYFPFSPFLDRPHYLSYAIVFRYASISWMFKVQWVINSCFQDFVTYCPILP